MFGTIMSDVTASSGNGGDFIVGDFNVNGVQIASTGNTNFALAFNLETANMWLDFPTADYAFVEAGGSFTTVFVEGENAFEV